jgi:undecaprenyl pyrophosphate phosphatase UppP
MLHLFLEKGPWFRAKKFGYGAGLPFKWQGWVVLGLYVLAMTGLGLLADNDKAIPTFVTVALMLILTGIFVVIVRKRTEGGWKWRGL